MAAAALLLLAAVLLDFATPHYSSAAPSPVSAMTPAIEAEPRKPQSSASVSAHAGVNDRHHEAAADAVGLLPRRSETVAPLPGAVDVTADGGAVTSSAVVSGAPHPRTARNSWNPRAGIAPDSTTLQTFRC
jgi:hypothetical protein